MQTPTPNNTVADATHAQVEQQRCAVAETERFCAQLAAINKGLVISLTAIHSGGVNSDRMGRPRGAAGAGSEGGTGAGVASEGGFKKHQL